jgi:hypothetical protein
VPGSVSWPDLRRWLQLEIVAGLPASALAGAVSRRVAGSSRGPVLLASWVLAIGLLEAAAITSLGASALARPPGGWQWCAPVVGTIGVLLGAWFAGRNAGTHRPRPERVCSAGTHRPRPGVTAGETLRYALPVAVLAIAALLARFTLPGLEGTDLHVASVALSLDLTVTAPGLVYLLLVRTRRAPWIVLLPAFALGYSLALATIPREHRTALDALRWAIVPAELAVVGYLVSLGRRALRAAPRPAGDFATRFRAVARTALAARVPADILATEVAILYHALRPRRAAPAGPDDHTSHRSTGYASVVLGLVLLLVVETFPVHVLVSRWSAAAAWALTGLSVYALLWLIGDLRAMSARPTRLRHDRLSVRIGLRWEAEIPIESIDRVEAPLSTDRARNRPADPPAGRPAQPGPAFEFPRRGDRDVRRPPDDPRAMVADGPGSRPARGAGRGAGARGSGFDSGPVKRQLPVHRVGPGPGIASCCRFPRCRSPPARASAPTRSSPRSGRSRYRRVRSSGQAHRASSSPSHATSPAVHTSETETVPWSASPPARARGTSGSSSTGLR